MTKRIIKPILVIIFLTSISSQTSAQLGTLIKVIDEVDLVVGPSYVTLRDSWWSTYGDKKIKIGYTAGIGVRYKMSDRMSLGGKILFERKGFKYEFNSLYYDDSNVEKIGLVQFTYNFNYLTMPFLFRYTFLKEGTSSFYVEGGPYVAYLLRGQSISYRSYNNTKQVTDVIENYKEFDFGISLGIGYKIHINDRNKLNFQLIDHFGLIPINKWEGNNIYTNSLSLLVGLTFSK